MTDAAGFVYAGERAAAFSVLPATSVDVGFRLVAHSSGLLPLPDIQLTVGGATDARLLLVPQHTLLVSKAAVAPALVGAAHHHPSPRNKHHAPHHV